MIRKLILAGAAGLLLSGCVPDNKVAVKPTTEDGADTVCAFDTEVMPCNIVLAVDDSSDQYTSIIGFRTAAVEYYFAGNLDGTRLVLGTMSEDLATWNRFSTGDTGECTLRENGAICVFMLSGHRFVVQNVPGAPYRMRGNSNA